MDKLPLELTQMIISYLNNKDLVNLLCSNSIFKISSMEKKRRIIDIWESSSINELALYGDINGVMYLYNRYNIIDETDSDAREFYLKQKKRANEMKMLNDKMYFNSINIFNNIIGIKQTTTYCKTALFNIFNINTTYYACINGNLELIKYIYTLDNQFITLKNIQVLCNKGHLEALKYIHSKSNLLNALPDYRDIDEDNDPRYFGDTNDDMKRRVMVWVCGSGNLEVVKYIYSIGGIFSIIAITEACKKGFIDIVQFIYNNIIYSNIQEIDINYNYYNINDEDEDNYDNLNEDEIKQYLMTKLMASSIISGKIECVMYIHSIRGIYTAIEDIYIYEAICFAAKNGYIDIIKYLYTNNRVSFENEIKEQKEILISGTKYTSSNIMLSAIYNEQLDMVKYLYSIGFIITNISQYRPNDRTYKLNSLGMSKNLEYIKYIMRMGGEIDSIDLKYAKANKNPEIIQYIYDELINKKKELMKKKRDDIIKEYSVYKSALQRIIDL